MSLIHTGNDLSASAMIQPQAVTVPRVVFSSPGIGQVFTRGSVIPIAWTITSSSPITSQLLRMQQVGSAFSVVLLQDRTGQIRSYNYAIPSNLILGDYAFDLIVSTASGVNVDSYAPVVHIVATLSSGPTFLHPHQGDTLNCNQVQMVQWSTPASAVSFYEIAIAVGAGVASKSFVTLNSHIAGSETTYYLYPPYVSSTQNAELRLTTHFASGSVAVSYSDVFMLTNGGFVAQAPGASTPVGPGRVTFASENPADGAPAT